MSTLEQDWLSDVAPVRNVGGRPRSTGTGCRQLKLACGACGFICRSTRGAVARCGTPRCGCGAELLLEDPRETEDERESERDARRVMRTGEREASYGFRTGAAPCKVCGRFKSRPAAICDHCGDVPYLYGGTTDAGTRESEREHNRAFGYIR